MTITDPEQVLATLKETRAALLDPLDIPRTWTTRKVHEYEERRRLLDVHITGISAQLDFINARTLKRAPLQASLDRLRKAEATIDKQIVDAPDWKSLVDSRARDQAWGWQQALNASRNALHRGLEFFNNESVMPNPLRELLTDTCPTCGHAELQWRGPIGTLEKEIGELDKVIAQRRVYLDQHLAGAATLLAEFEPVTS